MVSLLLGHRCRHEYAIAHAAINMEDGVHQTVRIERQYLHDSRDFQNFIYCIVPWREQFTLGQRFASIDHSEGDHHTGGRNVSSHNGKQLSGSCGKNGFFAHACGGSALCKRTLTHSCVLPLWPSQ